MKHTKRQQYNLYRTAYNRNMYVDTNLIQFISYTPITWGEQLREWKNILEKWRRSFGERNNKAGQEEKWWHHAGALSLC